MVVTARKREETAQSVPIPISALGGDQLESRNITEIADVTKLTPNLNLIKNYIKNSKLKISLNLNTVKMANLMLKADLAIGAS